MITVMGATGKVGGEIARQLLGRGVAVRALGRSEAKLAELAGAGAQPVMGDAGDPDVLGRAFDAADAVFTMLPFDPSEADYQAHQRRLGEAIVTAVRRSGTRRVVALSSIGADVPAGTGVLTGLYGQEQRLRALGGVDVQVLRPGSFYENFLAALPALQHEGAFTDVFPPDAPIPMIAVRDVAAAAVDALTTSHSAGYRVRELPGPADLTYAEATRILGARLGLPGTYVQLPAREAVEALAAYGFSPDAARQYVEMARAFETGLIRAREARDASGPGGTSFEDFAAELAAAASRA